MFNFFKNINKRYEERKKQKELKVLQVKKEIKSLEEKAYKISSDARENSLNEERKINSICPKCNQDKVTDRVTRQQGSINGNFSGSGWSVLTVGSSKMNGYVKGELDTNEINKCDSCGHEWKKHQASYMYSKDVLKSKVRSIAWDLKEYYEVTHCTFNPLDLNEKYYSLEEKQTALNKELNNSWKIDAIKEFWHDMSVETLKVLANKELSGWTLADFNKYYNEERLIWLGFKK